MDRPSANMVATFYGECCTGDNRGQHPISKQTMTQDPQRQQELKKMELCDSCAGIQRNWRKAPGHPELVQGDPRHETRRHGLVTITRYKCDRCGTAWEYENDKTNQKAGWSVVGR
jgi:hypothetical protein